MPKDRGARHGFAAQPGAKSRFHASAHCEPSICSSIQLTALHYWTPLRCGSRSHPTHFCARIVPSLYPSRPSNRGRDAAFELIFRSLKTMYWLSSLSPIPQWAEGTKFRKSNPD